MRVVASQSTPPIEAPPLRALRKAVMSPADNRAPLLFSLFALGALGACTFNPKSTPGSAGAAADGGTSPTGTGGNGAGGATSPTFASLRIDPPSATVTVEPGK